MARQASAGEATEGIVRWLARDDHRTTATSILPFLPAFLIFLVVETDGSKLSKIMLYLTTYGILWCVCQVTATYLVFGRMPASAFTQAIAASQPKRGKPHRLFPWMDDDAVSMGSQISVLMVGLTLFVFVTPSLRTETAIVVLSAGMVVSSWILTAFTYAIAYARADQRRPGLEFPGEGQPRFADFLYFAICVNATFATSDVTVTTTDMRQLVTTQTLIAFAFNTVIFALLITLLTVTSG